MKTIQEIKESIMSNDLLKNKQSELLKGATEAIELVYISFLYQDENQEGFLIAKKAYATIIETILNTNAQENTMKEEEIIKGMYNLIAEVTKEFTNDENAKDKTQLMISKIEYTNTFSKYSNEIKRGKMKYFLQGHYCDYIYDDLVNIIKKETKDIKESIVDVKYNDLIKVMASLNFFSLFRLTGNLQNLSLKRSGYINHIEYQFDELVNLIELLTKQKKETIEEIINYLTINKENNNNQFIINDNKTMIISPAYTISLFY